MADSPTNVARLAIDEATAKTVASLISETFDDAVCAAFEGDGGQWQVAIHFSAAINQAVVRALVARAAGEAVAQALSFEQVAEADWVAQSLAGLKPVRAGRFIVHGAHDRARIPVNAVGIEIEAALAFGTGHHGTTRGCLLALDALVKRRRQTPIPLPARGRVASKASRVWVKNQTPPRTAFGGSALPSQGRDKKILDVGTGSGVLAIAAARAFRTPVIAGDIDRLAVDAARGNARLNRTGHLVTLLRATGTRNPAITRHAPYDLIFANILLGPLTRLAVPLARLSRAGTTIVLSGLLPAHANAALASYRAQGLALERRILLDGWATLVLRKANRPGRGRPGRLRR